MIIGHASPTVGIELCEVARHFKTVGQDSYALVVFLCTDVEEQTIDMAGLQVLTPDLSA